MHVSSEYRFSPTGYHAMFKGKPKARFSPVVAWDDEGEPLVVHKSMLRRASRLDGFIDVHPCGKDGVVIPAEPGWTVRYVPDIDKETDVSTTLPIVAWKINESDMAAVPITIEHDSDWPDEWMDFGMKIDRLIPPVGSYPVLGIQGTRLEHLEGEQA